MIKYDFKDANINFNNNVEIFNVRTTCQPHIIQIIAKDNTDNILIILTWDFKDNTEISMYQQNCTSDEYPENYVVKGLNEKMNYFINQQQIIDLESNIPLQKSKHNSLKLKDKSRFNK